VATLQPKPTQEVRVSHDYQVEMSVGADITFLKDQFRPVLCFFLKKKSKKLQGP
jgi:hypothetical protein